MYFNVMDINHIIFKTLKSMIINLILIHTTWDQSLKILDKNYIGVMQEKTHLKLKWKFVNLCQETSWPREWDLLIFDWVCSLFVSDIPITMDVSELRDLIGSFQLSNTYSIVSFKCKTMSIVRKERPTRCKIRQGLARPLYCIWAQINGDCE